MKNNHGFTLVEMGMVAIVLGILAVLAIGKYRLIVAHDTFDKTVDKVYQELRSVRSIALKHDARVWVKFTTSQCSLFVDTSGDLTRQSTELFRVSSIPAPVTIGIAASGPTTAPSGIDWSTTGIAGNWKTATLTVLNDAVGTINSGAIYLQTSQLSKYTYCIGMSSEMQTMKLYKWEGSKWSIR